MKIDELLHLIESKKVTTDHFNLFIESIPKSADEKRIRRTRVEPPHERAGNPATTAQRIVRPGNTSPMQTGRGKKAVKKRGEENKEKASEFHEAIEFIQTHSSKPISECGIGRVADKPRLMKLVTRLLSTADHNVDRDWLHQVHQNLVGS